jgi:TRAP-type mannitol/chloroaromatic compound transport system substrate-binding protein
MERRRFIAKAAAGAGAGIIAAPALAQSQPAITWRLASSFPKSLDTIFGAADIFTKRIAQLTNGKFNIRSFAAGEIVPGLQVMDAVQAGTVECGHSASYYYFGKDATFSFDCAVPFGLTSRQHTAWYDQGGGRELMRAFFKDYNIINFLGGNSGTQMGGWFRKEIKSVADLKGTKMRVAGFAGKVLGTLGVVPQQLAGGDIYPALEKGTIDAAEWVGPYDDEKLGFFKVAPFYYAPGWWEPSASFSFYVNIKEWEKLPKDYQAAVEVATYEAHVGMQAEYDVKNPAALARLLKNGVKLRSYPKDVLVGCFTATTLVWDDVAAKNAKFKKVYEPWKKFRQDQNQWASVAEAPIQNYLIGASRLK